MKFNNETQQYEDEPRLGEDEQPQALTPAVPAAVTGELMKKGKYMTWGMIALIAVLFYPQLKKSFSKITRW